MLNTLEDEAVLLIDNTNIRVGRMMETTKGKSLSGVAEAFGIGPGFRCGMETKRGKGHTRPFEPLRSR
jgi:hypothetical protein